jgi:uncharacterized protein (DUF1800 family)
MAGSRDYRTTRRVAKPNRAAGHNLSAGFDRLGATAMARDPGKAALALHRFGFGPCAGTIAAIACDPQRVLAAERDRPNAGQIVDPRLASSAAEYRAAFEFIISVRSTMKRSLFRVTRSMIWPSWGRAKWPPMLRSMAT